MRDNSKIITLLIKHEGLRLKVYDDETSRSILPSTMVHGHPTIGIGRCLDLRGITEEEAVFLANNDVNDCYSMADSSFGWFRDLSDTRQQVIISMIFNMGLGKFKKFIGVIGAIEDENFDLASRHMLESLWARQVGQRAEDLSEMMRHG